MLIDFAHVVDYDECAEPPAFEKNGSRDRKNFVIKATAFA
jgi:hypothetical protein